MIAKVKRRIVRDTGVNFQHHGGPIILAIEQGGKVLKLWLKGRRKKYVVPIETVFQLGAKLAARPRDEVQRKCFIRPNRR